jgi:hypothetical protein
MDSGLSGKQAMRMAGGLLLPVLALPLLEGKKWLGDSVGVKTLYSRSYDAAYTFMRMESQRVVQTLLVCVHGIPVYL